MRLAQFILANVELILADWEAFARNLAPGKSMTRLALRDDAEAMLLATARDMQVEQSDAQQHSKSKGHRGAGGAESDGLDNAAALHAVARVGSGFDIIEVVAEYRALRASVLRLWRESLPEPDLDDIDDITRFNESIDQSLAQAVGSYTERVDQSRRMFVAILSHDMRNPLACIRMAALLVSKSNGEPDSAHALSMIATNTEAVGRLVNDLIEFASTGVGGAMPLTRSPVDLERLCRDVFEGFRSTHPHRPLRFHPDGDATGDWDAARLHQVVSNLMGNAVQHGSTRFRRFERGPERAQRGRADPVGHAADDLRSAGALRHAGIDRAASSGQYRVGPVHRPRDRRLPRRHDRCRVDSAGRHDVHRPPSAVERCRMVRPRAPSGIMSYTRWRNGRFLGELVREFKSNSSEFTTGFLACTPDFTDVGALQQVWLPEWSTGPVVQLRFPGIPTTSHADDPVAPDNVLEIRDATGAIVPTHHISVQAAPGFDERAVAAYRERVEVATSWYIAFVRRGAPTNASYSA